MPIDRCALCHFKELIRRNHKFGLRECAVTHIYFLACDAAEKRVSGIESDLPACGIAKVALVIANLDPKDIVQIDAVFRSLNGLLKGLGKFTSAIDVGNLHTLRGAIVDLLGIRHECAHVT